MQKDKKNQGAITVEASLVLTMFIMAYMCMMSLVQMVHAQAVLQYAADQTALEISRYSYILTKAGVSGKLYETSEKGKKFEDDTTTMVKSVTDFYDQLKGVKGANITNAGSKVQNLYDSGTNAVTTVENYFSNTDDLWQGIAAWGKKTAEGYAERAIVKAMVKSRIKKQLETMSSEDPDTYLRRLGVKDGLDGLDCSDSSWMQVSSTGEPGIKVAVGYEIEFKWFYFWIKDMKYKVCANTAIW